MLFSKQSKLLQFSFFCIKNYLHVFVKNTVVESRDFESVCLNVVKLMEFEIDFCMIVLLVIIYMYY